jgi:hypothetical protein
VTILYGSTSGLTSTNSQIWVQSSPGVPGLDELADHFGSDLLISALRGPSMSGLSIGIGGEDVGQARDAGAVTVLSPNSGGVSSAGSKTWSANSLPRSPGLVRRAGLLLHPPLKPHSWVSLWASIKTSERRR